MASGIAEVRELAHVYRVMAGARIRADYQYRFSFFAYTVAQGLITILDFGVILVLFGRIDSLSGWSVAEVGFLYGTATLAFHIGDVFISQVERAPQRIRMGTFDALLVRPLGPLFQLCADDFAFRRLGKLLQAIGVLAWALAAVEVHWSAGRVVALVVMLVSGTVIFSAIWVISSSLSFWIIEAGEIMNSFTYGSSFAAQYPLHVMATWLRRFLTFLVPAAFVNYFPSLYVLDKTDPLGVPGWVRFASPVVAMALVVVARSTWRVAIRHYRSTGS
ncbi:MAG TPA: ABC-2 family transporter protein [Acidimicrobiales bacterium]|nr:ABC-2 family transporter protein [Acidimicrobiales bacterium]